MNLHLFRKVSQVDMTILQRMERVYTQHDQPIALIVLSTIALRCTVANGGREARPERGELDSK